MKAKIKIKKAKNKELYFVLKANNNRILMTSETYKTMQGCQKGIKAVIKAMEPIVSELVVEGNITIGVGEDKWII